MAKFLQIVNGIPKMVEETAPPAIYDEYLLVVGSSPGPNEILGPVAPSTNITLPASGTYNGEELLVDLNGVSMENGYDFNFVGSPPRTQISFNFQLDIGDRIYIRKHRE